MSTIAADTLCPALSRRARSAVERATAREGLQPGATVSTEAKSLRVSVIIPALNEEQMIGKCLDHLALSDFSRDSYEVIVVDNGSTDRTVEIARSYSRQLDITVLLRPGVNISALRNRGAAAAKGEILAFLDADCLVPGNWLRNADRHLRSDDAGIVGGYISIPHDSCWPARAWYGVGYVPKDGVASYVPSGNLLMGRSAFLQIGGFNERLRTSEDCELCLRARSAGLGVRAVAEMAVVHLRTPQTLAEFYRRERWHGAHVAKVFVENLGSLANFRAVAFAVCTLICVAGVLAGLAMELVLRQYTVLVAALAGTVALPLACSIRKLREVRGKTYWLTLLPLALLHLVYGLARAQALLNLRSCYPREAKPVPSND